MTFLIICTCYSQQNTLVTITRQKHILKASFSMLAIDGDGYNSTEIAKSAGSGLIVTRHLVLRVYAFSGKIFSDRALDPHQISGSPRFWPWFLTWPWVSLTWPTSLLSSSAGSFIFINHSGKSASFFFQFLSFPFRWLFLLFFSCRVSSHFSHHFDS